MWFSQRPSGWVVIIETKANLAQFQWNFQLELSLAITKLKSNDKAEETNVIEWNETHEVEESNEAHSDCANKDANLSHKECEKNDKEKVHKVHNDCAIENEILNECTIM